MCGASIKYKARCEQTAALWMKFSPQLLEKFQLVLGKEWKYTNKLWEANCFLQLKQKLPIYMAMSWKMKILSVTSSEIW